MNADNQLNISGQTAASKQLSEGASSSKSETQMWTGLIRLPWETPPLINEGTKAETNVVLSGELPGGSLCFLWNHKEGRK